MTLLSRLLLTLALLFVPAALAAGDPAGERDDRERVFDAVVDVFRRNYWDPDYLDWQEWATHYRSDALSARSREAFDSVLGRMIGELRDDHSSWLGLVSYAHGDDLPEGGGPPRLGIRGSVLAGSGLVVERVFPGTAAEAAGLRRGDVIVRVDGRELNRPEARFGAWELLRQAAEQPVVSLEIVRGRVRITVRVVPEPFELSVVEQRPQAEMLDDRLGYLYVPSFNRDDIAVEVHRLLLELQDQGLSELVIDLRGNPGGRIGELGLTLGAFLEGTWARAVSRGDVVWQARYAVEDARGVAWLEDARGQHLVTRFVEQPASFGGPLAVLVDRRNSSAGEVAALVLQSQGRALVVGEPTHGNVEAIRGFDLPDGSVVMVAIANLEAADGRSFSSGVVPDSVARESLRELASGYDAPLAEAIRLLQALPFTPNRYFGKTAAN